MGHLVPLTIGEVVTAAVAVVEVVVLQVQTH